MKKLYQLFLIVVLSLFSLTVNADEIYWELKEAYDWAYSKWITTQSIENSRFSSPITRQATAKMIVKFATDVLWKSPDYNKACQFTDNDITEDLKPYVTKSCQLDLMWQNTYKFNPMWNVTRAQFWTILSRILWWSQYNVSDSSSTPYYEKHLKALQDAKILWYISDPMNYVETRSNVLLMLLRAYKYKNGTLNSPYTSSSSTSTSSSTTKTNSEYEIKKLEIIADILSDWSINVIESFTVNFNEKKHGIIRELPLRMKIWSKTYEFDVRNVIVTGSNYTTSKDNNFYEIKMWDEDTLVTWEKRYVVSYNIYWLISDFAWDWTAQLYWDILWDWFDTTINSTKVSIYLPKLYRWIDSDDIFIIVDWKTMNMDTFNWKIDSSSSSKIIITYDKKLSMNGSLWVVLMFPKNYFSSKLSSYYWWEWDEVYSWLVDKILPLVKDDTSSHLYEFLQAEIDYNLLLDNLTWSLEDLFDEDSLDDIKNPQRILNLLIETKDLQSEYNKDYITKLNTIKNKLNAKDDDYDLYDRIHEAINNVELTDELLDVMFDALKPFFEAVVEYWEVEDIPEKLQTELLEDIFEAMSVSDDFESEMQKYQRYINNWAEDVYKLLKK